MKKHSIKILVMDVDGTLTDGKIYMGAQGELMKIFDIKDGYAIFHILPAYIIIPIIITGRTSEIVEMRCNELGIKEIHQGCLDKRDKLMEIAQRFGLNIGESGIIEGSAYIGDDILYIQGVEVCEISACPADAAEEVKKIVSYICKNKGGMGAVREFVEWIICKD